MILLHSFEVVGVVLGLLFGSFLNVCISRIPAEESIVKPRSRCPNCHDTIRWFDNIPLISWLILRGKCRNCGISISWRYPAVELTVGIWFFLVSREWTSRLSGATPGEYIDLLGFAILGFLLIGLIVMDWQTLRLPDEFTLTGIGIGLFLVCSQAIFLAPGEDQIVLSTTHQLRLSSPGSFTARGNVFLTGPEALIFGRIAAVAGAALLLLIIRWTYKALRKRDGLGLGDVKMLAMVAAFLGFWPAILTLFIGIVCAAVYGVFLMVRGKAGALTRLPLGSFLGLGGLVAALFGNQILDWYRGLLS